MSAILTKTKNDKCHRLWVTLPQRDANRIKRILISQKTYEDVFIVKLSKKGIKPWRT